MVTESYRLPLSLAYVAAPVVYMATLSVLALNGAPDYVIWPSLLVLPVAPALAHGLTGNGTGAVRAAIGTLSSVVVGGGAGLVTFRVAGGCHAWKSNEEADDVNSGCSMGGAIGAAAGGGLGLIAWAIVDTIMYGEVEKPATGSDRAPAAFARWVPTAAPLLAKTGADKTLALDGFTVGALAAF